MLVLAFDTATDVATSALLDDGEVLGERESVAGRLLEDVRRAPHYGRAQRWRARRARRRDGPGELHEHEDRARGRTRARARARPARRGGLHARRARDVPRGRVPGRRREAARGLRPGAAGPRAGRRRARPGCPLHRQRRGALPVDVRGQGRGRSRPTTTRSTCRTPGSTQRSPATRRTSSCCFPSTSARRTRRRGARRDRGAPPPRSARPRLPSRRSSGRRTRRRGRTRCSRPSSGSRARSRSARSARTGELVGYRVRLALRRRLARHERRRHPRAPPARDRDRAPRAPVRGHRVGRRDAATRSRCGCRTQTPSGSTSASASSPAASGAGTTPTTVRTP